MYLKKSLTFFSFFDWFSLSVQLRQSQQQCNDGVRLSSVIAEMTPTVSLHPSTGSHFCREVYFIWTWTFPTYSSTQSSWWCRQQDAITCITALLRIMDHSLLSISLTKTCYGFLLVVMKAWPLVVKHRYYSSPYESPAIGFVYLDLSSCVEPLFPK